MYILQQAVETDSKQPETPAVGPDGRDRDEEDFGRPESERTRRRYGLVCVCVCVCVFKVHVSMTR